MPGLFFAVPVIELFVVAVACVAALPSSGAPASSPLLFGLVPLVAGTAAVVVARRRLRRRGAEARPRELA